MIATLVFRIFSRSMLVLTRCTCAGPLRIGVVLLFASCIAAAQGPVRIAGREANPGTIFHFEAPLSAKAQALAKIGGNTPPAHANCGLVLPLGFSPAQPRPILIWNSSQHASAVQALGGLSRELVESGWIGLAADGSAPAALETTEWCLAMLAAALEEMERSWPNVKRWPIACGGFSGGAKRAPYIAAALMEHRYRLSGLFLAGCNEDRATDALRWHQPGPAFKQLPIFLSTGRNDEAVNAGVQALVSLSLEKSGFTDVRQAEFPGAHELNGPHLVDALRIFAETLRTR